MTSMTQKRGRPKKPTKVMRIPVELADQLESYAKNEGYRLPLLTGKVPAGFPLNATDHISEWVDLNQQIIKDPSCMFLIEATGDSMEGAHIRDGDLLVVDGSIEARHGMIVVAAVNGEYTVKTFFRKDNQIKLVAANANYPDIDISPDSSFAVAGVVVRLLRKFSY